MAELDKALLRLRASMVLKAAEQKLKRCSDEDRRTGLTLRAYYLGREFSGAEVNPFTEMDHPNKEELVHGFSMGASSASVDNPISNEFQQTDVSAFKVLHAN